MYRLVDKNGVKYVRSSDYNYNFNKRTGMFLRWGKTLEDDPTLSPIGPEIADIEITTICKGPNGIPCPFCYKANTYSGRYMDLDTYKVIFNKLNSNNNLTQVAFGVDAQCESNPDVWRIMEYTLSKGVVPNVTVADISDKVADKLAFYCGAVAVSRYSDKDICYNTVKKLTDRGMTQVNIHSMLSQETLVDVCETILDVKRDDRLEKLNAVVILSLKQKGRGVKYTPVSQEHFDEVVLSSMVLGTRIGFDSCSANKFLKTLETLKNCQNVVNNILGNTIQLEQMEKYVEPCESGLFSAYVNVDGVYHHCSFAENETKGVDLKNKNLDFINDVWYSQDMNKWRGKLLSSNRNCPIYNV